MFAYEQLSNKFYVPGDKPDDVINGDPRELHSLFVRFLSIIASIEKFIAGFAALALVMELNLSHRSTGLGEQLSRDAK